MAKQKDNFFDFPNTLSLIIIIFSLTGLWASLILSIEIFQLLKDPSITFGCSINSAINCVSVMKSWQAEILGFPNTFIGLAAYAGFLLFGVILLTKVKLHKNIMLLANIAAFGAFIFSYWLLSQSVYVINSLCPYCLLSCFSATNIFFAITLFNLKENTLELKKDTNAKIQNFINNGFHIPVIVLWYMAIAVLVVMQFRETLFQ